MPEMSIPRDRRREIRNVFYQFPSLVHEFGFIDFSHHNRMMDTFSAESIAPGSHAEEPDISKRGAKFRQPIVILVAEPEPVDLVSHLDKPLGDKDRQIPAAGDETDRCGGGWGVG